MQFAVVAADQDVRHVVVHVLVRVAHVAAVQQQRMIEQRAVAIVGVSQFVDEVRQHLHVILVDLRQLLDRIRIFAVVRAAMEAQRRATRFPDRRGR